MLVSNQHRVRPTRSRATASRPCMPRRARCSRRTRRGRSPRRSSSSRGGCRRPPSSARERSAATRSSPTSPALLDLPLAANCVAAASSDGGAEVTRVRWGGSLLEVARVHAPTALLTVQPHAVAIETTSERRPGRRDVHPDVVRRRSGAPGRRARRSRDGRYLARRREGRRLRRARRRLGGGLRRSSRSSPGCSAPRSAARAP